jgi:hypothetical protein
MLPNAETHRYSCTQEGCTKSFKTSFSLKRHQMLHTSLKEFQCNECHKSFALKQYLQEHSYTHTKEKPYECGIDGCPLKFRHACKLSVHRKTHGAQRIKRKAEDDNSNEFTHLPDKKVCPLSSLPLMIDFFDFSLYLTKIHDIAESAREECIKKLLRKQCQKLLCTAESAYIPVELIFGKRK